MSKGQANQPEGESTTSSRQGAKRADWISRALLLGGIVLLSGVMLMQVLPSEISRWYQAAAMVHSDRGEWDKAVRSLDRAVAYDARYPGVFQLRGRLTLMAAEARVEAMLEEIEAAAKEEPLSPAAEQAATQERAEILEQALQAALADYEKALTLSAQYGGAARDISSRLNQADILQRLGRHKEAVALCNETLKETQAFHAQSDTQFSKYQLSQVLNMLAYVRARGEVDLPEALAEINGALTLLEESGVAQADPTVRASYLDTRGVIHYRMGNYQQALVDLDSAIAEMRANYTARERQLDWQLQLTHDEKSFNEQLKQMRNNLSVIHYHRGQVFEKIGRQDAAALDFAIADDYGYSEELGVW